MDCKQCDCHVCKPGAKICPDCEKILLDKIIAKQERRPTKGAVELTDTLTAKLLALLDRKKAD